MNRPTSYTQEDLLDLLQQQDQRAITYLCESYAPALYNIILKTIRQKEPAAEVLQDSFVKICRNIDQYDSKKGRLFTWMARIARNSAIDKLRSGQFKRGEKTEGLPDYVNNDERFSESIHTADPALRKVLEQLEPRSARCACLPGFFALWRSCTVKVWALFFP